MLSTLAFAAAALPFVLADNPITPGFPYGSEKKVRGVSLGGWLVTHPWIAPSIYDATGNPAIVDEWTFGELQDYDVAQAALQHHWETFYSEDDFAAIAAAGLNHVRIPIGYWAFEVGPGEPFITGQLPYLQKALVWAGNHDLNVIVELSGAPGSQNGQIESGHITTDAEMLFNTTDIQRANDIIKTIASMAAAQGSNIVMIEPLEDVPSYFGPAVADVINQFYYDSYGNIRYPYGTSQESNTVVLLNDAFKPLSAWEGFMTPPDWQGVAFDAHSYQGFWDTNITLTEDEHIQLACSWGRTFADFDLWAIMGEWCPAVTDCAAGLNGRGNGSFYDGTWRNGTAIGSCEGKSGSASTFSDEYKTFLRKYWEAQTIAYEEGTGWIQWLWKTEAGAGEEWSYSAGLANGWIPQDPTDRIYPNICSS